MALRADQILYPTDAGLYCEPGDFYIDPLRPVPRALVTHGHADHARPGHNAVLASQQTLEIMAIRYGEGFTQSRQIAQGRLRVGNTYVSFHPAGHVLGSCQILIEPDYGPRIVASGDYCRVANPVCLPFEPIPCDVFITEATFGLPVFNHPPPDLEMTRLLRSLDAFPDRPHLIGAYALGKAQRVIALLRGLGYEAPIALHGALVKLSEYHVSQGIYLGEIGPLTALPEAKVIIAPPSAFAATWAQRFKDPVLSYASGWMTVRARARQRRVELPLIISDHVDWPQVTSTLRELSPEEVWITHGSEEGLMRWCALEGLAARPLRLIGYEAEPE